MSEGILCLYCHESRIGEEGFVNFGKEEKNEENSGSSNDSGLIRVHAGGDCHNGQYRSG